MKSGWIACFVVGAVLVSSGSVWGTMEDFEGLSLGSIAGQAGWTVGDSWGNVNAPYDEAVVDDGSGNKVWRISDAITTTSYSDKPFSQISPQVAGESSAYLYNDYGPDYTHPYNPPQAGAAATSDRFVFEMDFCSATGAAQAGFSISLSPSAKQSTVRMSYLNITDNGSGGFDLLFYDTSDGANGWNATTVATDLSYADWHSVKMDVTFVDGLDTSGGQNDGNDAVEIWVDGALVHMGTTWESYFDSLGRVQAVDSMMFRTAGDEHPDYAGGGIYIDNVSVGNGSEPVVPEPVTMVAMAAGLCGVGGYLRRRRA